MNFRQATATVMVATEGMPAVVRHGLCRRTRLQYALAYMLAIISYSAISIGFGVQI
jgi:hypothetical protein